MGNLLYLLIVLLIIIWVAGFLVVPFGGNLIHLVLVLIVIFILLRMAGIA